MKTQCKNELTIIYYNKRSEVWNCKMCVIYVQRKIQDVDLTVVIKCKLSLNHLSTSESSFFTCSKLVCRTSVPATV